MKLTPKTHQYLRSVKAPWPGLIIDIVDGEDGAYLRVYRSNLESFSESHRQDLIFWLEEILRHANFLNNGLPIYMEAAE